MSWLIPTRSTGGFFAAFSVLIGIVSASYVQMLKASDTNRWVNHTHEVLEKTTDLFSQIQDAETGQRGYLLTGESRYLEPYQTATQRIDRDLRSLQSLTIDNPLQQQRLKQLAPLINAKLQELNQTIQVRRTRGLDGALRIVRGDRGRQIMDEIRLQINAIETTEQQLLQERSRTAQSNAFLTVAATGLGNSLALGLIAIAGLTINRELNARKQLSDRLQRYANLFDQAQFGLAIDNPNGETLDFINPAFASLHGYTVDELIGKPFRNLYPLESRADLATAIEKVQQYGHYTFESMHQRKDGSVFPGQTSVTAIQDAEKNLMYCVIALQDISDRYAAQAEITSLNEKLRDRVVELQTLLEIIPIGVAIASDRDCTLIRSNAYIRQLLGVEPDANVSKSAPPHGQPNYRTVKNGQDIPADQLPMQVAARENITIRDAELEVLLPDGTTIDFLSYAAPIHDRDGNVSGAIGAFADVTERKRLEAEREELLRREKAAREEAELASRTKDEFLAIASHELRAPLNAILGWAKLLRARNLPHEQVAKALEVIERNAQSQSQLIEDLLDISRIIRGKVRLDRHPVSFQTVVEAAIDAIRPLADAKAIQIQVSQLDSATVLGDDERLQQIVWNLLSNAVKFTPEAGQIEVRLSTQNDLEEISAKADRAQLQITDTGKGISPDFLPYVFDRFRQAENATSRSTTGLGLGLAIVRSLVDLHDGTIRAISEGEGRGATFTLQLPLTEASTSSLPAPQAIGFSSLENSCILIVDDEQDTREVVAATLELHGAISANAASAREALALCATFKPDLLISDIGMPIDDGYTLIRRLRDSEQLPNEVRRIPAIALSAYAREDDQNQAIAAGFQKHLSKPFDAAQLVQTISALLEKRTA